MAGGGWGGAGDWGGARVAADPGGWNSPACPGGWYGPACSGGWRGAGDAAVCGGWNHPPGRAAAAAGILTGGAVADGSNGPRGGNGDGAETGGRSG